MTMPTDAELDQITMDTMILLSNRVSARTFILVCKEQGHITIVENTVAFLKNPTIFDICLYCEQNVI